MKNQNGITVIIVAYNSGLEIMKCIESIVSNIISPFEIIIVDNSPKKNEIISKIERYFSMVRVISLPQNPGFGAANNLGTEYARYDVIMFINPDTMLLSKIKYSSAMINEKTGIISGYCVDSAGLYKKTAGFFPKNPFRLIFFSRRLDSRGVLGSGDFRGKSVDVQYTEGSLYIISLNLFRACGKFDENIFMYGEDYELSYRVFLSGRNNMIDGNIVYYHKGGFNHKREPLIVNGLLYFADKHVRGFQGWLIKFVLFVKYINVLIISSFMGIFRKRYKDRRKSAFLSIKNCLRA